MPGDCEMKLRNVQVDGELKGLPIYGVWWCDGISFPGWRWYYSFSGRQIKNKRDIARLEKQALPFISSFSEIPK